MRSIRCNFYTTLLFGLLLSIVFIMSLVTKRFFSVENLLGILRQASLVLIVAVGMTQLMILGEVDLSVGALLAFSGYIAVDILNYTSSFLLALIGAILFCGIVGVFNGLVITKLKINSLISTIATTMILRGAIYLYSTEAIQNASNNSIFPQFGAGYIFGFPFPFLLAFSIFLVTYLLFNKTSLMRIFIAIGSNKAAAKTVGININKYKFLTFVATSMLVGIAGTILASYMNAGQPTAGKGFELMVVSAVILGGTSFRGGKGSLLGTIIGILILKVIDNSVILLGWNQDLQMVFPGVVIILAVYFEQLREKQT